MKKALKISVSILLLALAIGVTQIPVEQVTADGPTVSKDSEFQMNGSILIKYTGTAQAVSVPAGVTVIGEEAFAGNTTMETLAFKGEKVESIAYNAFADCTALEKVTLPNSLLEIGNGAFQDCSSLKEIYFGKELYKLGIGPFTGCYALEKIVVPEENTYFSVANDCLYNGGKSKLYTVFLGKKPEIYTMPSSVEDIAPYAFWGCETIKAVGLSGGLEEIPDYAFANCKSLASISIPYSVREIGIKAFSDCVNLETVAIPSAVTTIHETAFDGCVKLKIVAEEGTVAAKYYLEWKERNQAEYEDILGDYVVSGGDAEKPDEEAAGNVLGSTHVVGNRAVVFINNLDMTAQGTPVQGEDLENAEINKGTDIPKYVLAHDSILADQAFYKSQDMANYKLKDGITEIGEFTFARSNLSYIDIPDGVKTIGYGAFYHCDYLRDVDIPRSVTYIAPKAFAESQWLNGWLAGAGEDFLIVGDGILLAYRGDDAHIVIPDEVERIAPEVFAGNSSIISVTLPDALVDIGEDAFASCTSLRNIYGGDNVKYIRDRAFSGCPIETAHVGGNVEYLGLQCFDFANTAFSVSQKVIVFEAEDVLPKSSYEMTAERLSNEQARGMLLGDTKFVVVDKLIKANELEGTILDAENYGFKGIVCYISSFDKHIVSCIATTYTPEEFANCYIPEYISIDGVSYKVTEEENITVFGNEQTYSTGSILVENEKQDTIQAVSAVLEGNNGAYTLQVSDSADAADALSTAYEAVYRESLPEGVLCADISLVEQKTGVKISRLGKQKLTITMTLPESAVAGSVRILTTDRNGQLENIDYTRSGNTFTFSVNHLSPFAFARVGSRAGSGTVYAEGLVQGEDGSFVATGSKLDESPDTGDFLHPKWFLAAGLASMAIAVLFIKKKH